MNAPQFLVLLGTIMMAAACAAPREDESALAGVLALALLATALVVWRIA